MTAGDLPAVVIHANKIEPWDSVLLEDNVALQRHLPVVPSCLEVAQQDSRAPDVLHPGSPTVQSQHI